MDLQKEIAQHENWYKQDDPIAHQYYLSGSPEFVQDFGQSEKSWLAAKAQAIPEGFVLVPKEPTSEIIDAMNDFDIPHDYSDMDGAYRSMIKKTQEENA